MKIKILFSYIHNFVYLDLFRKLIKNFITISLDKDFCIITIKEKQTYYRSNNSFIDYILFGILKGYKIYLELKGSGYKIRLISNVYFFGLILRLGFSHLIYIKLFKDFRISFFNRSTLCFYSNNFFSLQNKIKLVTLQKKINVYKGKGIF
jgi:ribosomal protein L6P/L9E